MFAETGGAVRITISIGCDNPIEVSYRTEEETAEAALDYTDVSGSFTISRSTPRAFDLPVIDDGVAEEDETLHLILEGATDAGGTCLRVPDADIVLTIHDDGDLPTAAPASTPTSGEGEPGGVGGADGGEEPAGSDEDQGQVQSEQPESETARAEESTGLPGVFGLDLVLAVLAGLVLGAAGVWFWLRRRAAP